MVCYYAKKKNKNLKPRKFFYGRWFVNMTELFSWILFFPFVIIFISFIACNKDVLVNLNLYIKLLLNNKIFLYLL